MSKASNSSNPIPKPRQVDPVTPPLGFYYVEESIARCSRATRQNVSFLRTSAVGSFVNVSGEELNSSIENFANENAIPVHNVFSGGQSPLTLGISLFEEFIKSTIELILRLSCNRPVVLIIGSPSHCIDSIIIACLRRVQEWSFVSILGELRMHSGCRQFDVEQFIESFNPDIVDISKDTPDYLQIHIRLKDEEEKLVNRLEQHRRSTASSSSQKSSSQDYAKSDTLTESDMVLCKLLLSPKVIALSPGITFDPSISLINDKDDDD